MDDDNSNNKLDGSVSFKEKCCINSISFFVIKNKEREDNFNSWLHFPLLATSLKPKVFSKFSLEIEIISLLPNETRLRAFLQSLQTWKKAENKVARKDAIAETRS